MCFVVFAYRMHSRYRLVFASNRDEFYERPSVPASFWEDEPDVLAGRDLRGGGTWMGITRSGHFAALTNHRDMRTLKEDAPTRGALVANFLTGERSPKAYLEKIAPVADRFNGFNLLVGDTENLYYCSNEGEPMRLLTPGLYGLSNAVLNVSWPKVERGKEMLDTLLQTETVNVDALFDLLSDKKLAPIDALPDTGIGSEWERVLSPIFIESPTYGTRASTIVLIDYEDHVTFVERVTGPNVQDQPAQRFSFSINTEQDVTSKL